MIYLHDKFWYALNTRNNDISFAGTVINRFPYWYLRQIQIGDLLKIDDTSWVVFHPPGAKVGTTTSIAHNRRNGKGENSVFPFLVLILNRTWAKQPGAVVTLMLRTSLKWNNANEMVKEQWLNEGCRRGWRQTRGKDRRVSIVRFYFRSHIEQRKGKARVFCELSPVTGVASSRCVSKRETRVCLHRIV